MKLMNMDTSSSDDTKLRLLEAAGKVISEKGFHQATTREICKLARANNAAVNYHFGDKLGLYNSLLRSVLAEGLSRYPLDMDTTPEACAAERLRAVVRSFFLRLLSDGRPGWFSTLMTRELLEPTPALDQLVREAIMPMWRHLLGLVAELLGPAASEETVACCASSVIGQCHHYITSRSVIHLLRPELTLNDESIEDLAEHVTRFSLAALAYCREHPETQSPDKS